MPKKKEAFILTHTEIYARAIRTVESDIAVWQERCNGLPQEHFEQCTAHLRQKLDALKQLYKLECGNDYD